MKNILIGAVILIFISLQVNGQQSQDTLYLKNGYNAVGKLLEKSMTEYRFKKSDGIIFTFSSSEVEKVVPAKGPVIYPASDSLKQANKIRNHSKGQSMLLASPTVLLNTPKGVQVAGGIKYQLFISERFSMDADFVIGKDYWHLGPGLLGLPLGLLFINQSSDIESNSDSWLTFLIGVAAVALSFEHISYHIPVNSNLDISPYVSLMRYKSSHANYNRSDTTFVGEQLSFATGMQINKYSGRYVFSPYVEYNLGYKDLASRFNVGVYFGLYFARNIY